MTRSDLEKKYSIGPAVGSIQALLESPADQRFAVVHGGTLWRCYPKAWLLRWTVAMLQNMSGSIYFAEKI